MPTGLPVSADVDALMRSADKASARSNLGVFFAKNENLSLAGQNLALWGDSLTQGDKFGPGGQFTWCYYLTPWLNGVSVYNGGVGGESSTQIKARMLAATDKHGWPTVIWAGRNNYADTATTISDIADMVAALDTDDYIVLSVINGANEGIGTGAYTDIVDTIDASLASTYGSRYLNVRSLLIDSYNPEDAQDVIDHAEDLVPASFRIDNIHLTSAANELIANAVYSKLAFLYPGVEPFSVITLKNIEQLFRNHGIEGNYFRISTGRIQLTALDGTGDAGFGPTGIGSHVQTYGGGFVGTTGNQDLGIPTPTGRFRGIHAKYLELSEMPTSDPAQAGYLWNDGGTVKISAG